MQHDRAIARLPVDGGATSGRCRDGHRIRRTTHDIRLIALAVTAAACLSSVAHAEEREPVSVRVSYAGLNLASVKGRRILDACIDRAALHACQSRIMDLRRLNDERRCRTKMHSDAQVRMAQLTPVAVANAR